MRQRLAHRCHGMRVLVCVRCRVCGACQRVAENAPTVLPLAQRAYRFPPASLRNRQIAFGCGRIAVRASARRALGCGGVLRHGWHGRAGASLRRSLRPRLPVRRRVRASSAHERHPARSEYLPSPPAAPVRRCAHPAARARSGPVPALRPLARYWHMSVSAVRVPRTLQWARGVRCLAIALRITVWEQGEGTAP